MDNQDVNRLERELLKLFKLLRKKPQRNIALVATENGIIELILEGFDMYGSNSRICIILNQIIRNLQSGNMYRFFDQGGGMKVLNSMAQFYRDKYVQAAGCYAIRALASVKSNAIKLVSDIYNVHEVIQAAMEYHARDTEVQKAACSAVWCLSTHDKVSDRLWEVDFPKLIIKSLKDHPQRPKIQEYGLQALKQIKALYSLVRLGAAEVVVSALKNHMANEYVVLPCLKLIRVLCNYKSNAQVLQRLGIAKAVVDSLLVNVSEHCRRSASTRQVINVKGCVTFFHLSGWDFLLEPLFQAKVSRVFIAMIQMNDFKNNNDTFNYVIHCLENFAESERYVREFLTIRLFEALVDQAASALRIDSKRHHVGHLFDVLHTSCTTCIDARQPIKVKTNRIINTIERNYPYEEIYTKASRLKLLLY